MRDIQPTRAPRCPGCGAHHYPATNGAGRRVWCDGTEDKGNGASLIEPERETVPDTWPPTEDDGKR